MMSLRPPPPPPQVRLSPLTFAQLSVVLAALCHGIPQASLQHHASPQTIRAWIALQERGLSSGKWPWKTEKLAEWVLVQREQQLQVSKVDLLRAARSALGESSLSVDQFCWSVDFMLRHRLNFRPTKVDDFKFHRLALPQSLREKSCSFIQNLNKQVRDDSRPLRPLASSVRSHAVFLSLQIHSCPVPPHRFGAMDEFSIFIDPYQLSTHKLSAFQLCSSSVLDKPMFDIVLSALSDGSFLPPLLLFTGNPSPVPEGFPDNVLLEARQEGFTAQERHKIWINKVDSFSSHSLSLLY